MKKTRLARQKETPLAYMLRIMNDQTVPDSRRDRMANMAAPYVHPRLIPQKASKKLKQEQEAMIAGVGTPWSADLSFTKASAN